MRDDAIEDCTKSLELEPNFLKALRRRAQIFEQKHELEKALQDYKSILEKDPSAMEDRANAIVHIMLVYTKNENFMKIWFFTALGANCSRKTRKTQRGDDGKAQRSGQHVFEAVRTQHEQFQFTTK